jgi:hypothetical protein
VAEETDAARDRVIAARADLASELEVMEASLRAAVDIPAKIRRSPAKVAAVVGGVGFLALKGPQRIVRGVRRAVRGPEAELPKAMLPDEIEKTLRSLGSDGDKVRGKLERDFAAYATKAQRDRAGRRRELLVSAAAPLVFRGIRTAAERLLSPGEEGFAAKLAEMRERAERSPEDGTDTKAGPVDGEADAGA